MNCESIAMDLTNLHQLPLFRAALLLKEAMVGFERLHSRYGAFAVTAKMIVINKDFKCKVWISENMALNQPKCLTINEESFVKSIVDLIHQRVQANKSNQCFFEGLTHQATFHQVLHFIEKYVKKHKVIVPTSFRHMAKQKKPDQERTSFDNNLTMGRITNGLERVRGTVPYQTSKRQVLDEEK